MNDFTFMKKMNEEDAYLFKRCIRKMLDTTFIVADKDEKLYDFISSESNQYDVNTYLAAIGYKVVVEERMKVAMLQQSDEDVETVGLKRINLYRFDAKQVKLLMVLWLLFLERMGYADPVHITVGDIIDIFGEQLSGFLTLGEKPPNNYQFAVQGICDAIKDMPHCIFDVMRGRCIFSITHDTMEENGELWRYGIKSSRLTEKINEISANIREERDYGYQ